MLMYPTPPSPATLISGIFAVVAGSTDQTIPITGLASGSIVNLTWIGTTGQTFVSYTPTTDNLTISLAEAGVVGAAILWSVAAF